MVAFLLKEHRRSQSEGSESRMRTRRELQSRILIEGSRVGGGACCVLSVLSKDVRNTRPVRIIAARFSCSIIRYGGLIIRIYKNYKPPDSRAAYRLSHYSFIHPFIHSSIHPFIHSSNDNLPLDGVPTINSRM